MTAQNVYTKLKSSGFHVEMFSDDYVVASLNRRVFYSEVEAALDFEVTREHMERDGIGGIVIMGTD